MTTSLFYYCLDDRGSDLKYLPDDLAAGIFYPVDLNAYHISKTKKLNHEIAKEFFSQSEINSIFDKVTNILVKAMHDKELFSFLDNKQHVDVNPLFICLRQLIVLYGGIAAKIYEVNGIISSNDNRKKILLETQLGHDTFLPIVDYYDVLKVYFLNQTKFINKPNKEGGKLDKKANISSKTYKHKIISHIIQLNNYLSDKLGNSQSDVAVVSTKNTSEYYKGLFSLRKRRWPKIIQHTNNGRAHSSSGKGYLRRALAKLNRVIYDELDIITDYNSFCTLIDKTYLKYIDHLECHIESALLNISQSSNPNTNNSNRYIITRATLKPDYLAYIYQKYAQGYKVITQQYADGTDAGTLQQTIAIYRSTPISDILIYDNDLCMKANRNYINNHPSITKGKNFFTKGDILLKRKDYTKSSQWKQKRIKSIAYLPTTYTGHLREGPHREINDIVCWEVQKNILNSLLKLDDVDVVFKAHPKSKFQRIHRLQLEYCKAKNIRIEYEPLDKVVSKLDLVITDYYASGMISCMYKNMPLIYLDFGYNKFFDETFELCSKSFHYIKASVHDYSWKDDLTSLSRQIIAGQDYDKYYFVKRYKKKKLYQNLRHIMNSNRGYTQPF